MPTTSGVYIFALWCSVGIALSSWKGGVCIMVVACMCIFVCMIFRSVSSVNFVHIKGSYTWNGIVFLSATAFVCGGLRYALHEYLFSLQRLSVIPLSVEIVGVVDDEPEVKEKDVRLVVKTRTINGVPRSLRLLVSTSFYPQYSYGDEVHLKGSLKDPREVEVEDFNYEKYLAKENIVYVMYSPRMYRSSVGGGNVLKRILFSIKRAFLNSISRAIPPPEVALGGGLVVGAKENLGKELEDDLRRAGVIHMVVLSGFNVTVIAQTVLFLLSFLSRRNKFICGVVGIILFTILTGGTPTVVRSALMTCAVLFADLIRREYNVLRSLIIAGMMMLMSNPYLLLYDTSFELSFLATMGLILLTPHIEDCIHWVHNTSLRSILSSTLATQIFVLPLILLRTGQVSLVGLGANILIVPFIPLTMLGVTITGCLGFVHQGISVVVGLLSSYLLSYELAVVRIFAHIPFAVIQIKGFSVWMVIVSYMVYASILWWLNRRKIRQSGVS